MNTPIATVPLACAVLQVFCCRNIDRQRNPLGVEHKIALANDIHTGMLRSCPSCQMLCFNGVLFYHEEGCPDAWREEIRLCPWCKTEFIPVKRYQQCCKD